jgi:glycosyltransferase involved in cell wall biosynthesis
MELIIAGEGKQRAALTQLIESQGLSDMVRLPGFAANPREFLAGLHLYVQPSRSEGFCIAAHEAMQAGLPVIASRVGEMPNTVIHGTTGMIVSPGAPDELAAALEKLLAHPERLAAMGSAARASVLAKFSAARFAAAGAAIIDRIRS